MKIPANTKIHAIDLRVKDLKRSLTFYSELLGLRQAAQDNAKIFLSSDGNLPYLVSLEESPSALYPPENTPGLFHIAFRFPNRAELGKVFIRLFNHRIKFTGFSDHIVSEAIYLNDPEGNGIELYTDKPKEEWKWISGQIQMDTLPLNLNVLIEELKDQNNWDGIHPLTDIGHIHLKVSDLKNAEMFYHKILGFDITSSAYPGALFFSTGGYHHHIGANTWKTRNGFPRPENSTGLISYTIQTPDKGYIEKVEQAAQKNNLLLRSLNGKSLELLDFDKNKIKLSL